MKSFIQSILVAGLLAAWLIWLGGCAGIIHELAGDSAIIVTTGFYLSIGPTVENAYIPNIKIGFGTVARIGGDRDVTLTVGQSGSISEASNLAEKMNPIPELKGMSSIHIRAKNPKMKDAETTTALKPLP